MAAMWIRVPSTCVGSGPRLVDILMPRHSLDETRTEKTELMSKLPSLSHIKTVNNKPMI